MKNQVWLYPLVVPTTFLLAWALTGALRRYALAHHVIDTPNERSSHTVPTPRGGGLAIVASFLLLLPVLALMGRMDWTAVLGIGGAGLGIAVLGFLDDHGHIAARWRLLGHFAAAAWVLVWIDGLPPNLNILGVVFDAGWFGYLLAALYLVWSLNLYNFMDGIDGIASVEAIFAALGGATFYIMVGSASLAVAPIILACAVAGFLCWNFPPAKIFMGDAGSGFLGIVLGAMALQAAWVQPQLLWSWLILLGVFIVDATLTLLRRLIRRDKVYEAHRSHAYQWAARRLGAHLPVTLAVAGLNLCWLYPLACLVAIGKLDGFAALAIAYFPLILLALRFRCGQAEPTAT